MYDYAKRFCEICTEASNIENPIELARLIGQLEILAEICAVVYPLPAICEGFQHELQNNRLRLLTLATPVVPDTESIPKPEPGPKILYKQEYVRCGKPRCRKCTEQQVGHGPYWYAYRFTKGHSIKRYVGLNLPDTVQVGHDTIRYISQPESEAALTCSANCDCEQATDQRECCRRHSGED